MKQLSSITERTDATSVTKRERAEEMMVDLMYGIAENLLTKLRTGEASHQDISNAIKLLQNNGITVAVNKGSPLDILKEDLPFHGTYTMTN